MPVQVVAQLLGVQLRKGQAEPLKNWGKMPYSIWDEPPIYSTNLRTHNIELLNRKYIFIYRGKYCLFCPFLKEVTVFYHYSPGLFFLSTLIEEVRDALNSDIPDYGDLCCFLQRSLILTSMRFFEILNF